MGIRAVRDQTSHRNAGSGHGADEVAKNPVRRDHGLGRDGRPRTERSQAGRHEPTTNERRTADQSHWADPGMITVLTLGVSMSRCHAAIGSPGCGWTCLCAADAIPGTLWSP